MKLYVKLISLTAALGFIFVIGYLSGLAVDTSTDWWLETAPHIALLPSGKVFQVIWIAVYLLFVILLTPTVSERKLRIVLPLWLILGALNVVCACVIFALRLPLFGLGIIVTEIALLSAITDFYVQETRLLWSTMIPLLSWYIFQALLLLDALI